MKNLYAVKERTQTVACSTAAASPSSVLVNPSPPAGAACLLCTQEVDAESGAFEVVVLSEDVSTFLILAPEGEYLGAKVQGFIPREDGGLSALEMHGQVGFLAGV